MILESTRPASRILGLLEILQDSPGINGPALSDRLGVTPRTIRRYVATLQEMGIPVEPVAGRTGGYWLRPGYRLPPLMFSTEEAIGLSVALMTASESREDDLPEPVLQALTKITRVLPDALREQIDAIREAMQLPSSRGYRGQNFPLPSILATLSQATLSYHSVWFRYGRPNGEESARTVDPYGVVVIFGKWYLHGWCHLRRNTRTFRIDRIRRVDLLSDHFDMPPEYDVVRAVEASLALSRDAWEAELILDGPIEKVQRWIETYFAVLSPTPDGRTHLRATFDDPDWFAWRVCSLPFDIEVIKPNELRHSMRRLGQKLLDQSGHDSESTSNTKARVVKLKPR